MYSKYLLSKINKKNLNLENSQKEIIKEIGNDVKANFKK